MKVLKRVLILVLLSTLYGCGSDNDNTNTSTPIPEPQAMSYSFSVVVTNLTQAQPLSPIGIALHQEGQFWEIGMEASEALEQMAESGDNTLLLLQRQLGISK